MALGDVIARLAVSLSIETAALEKGATIAEKRFEQTRRKFERTGKSMSAVGNSLAIAVTAPLAAIGVASYKAAQESADALGQVRAALASMGDASGRTLEQLQALAQSQMAQSLYDDDEILRKVTANLLTFGNVAGQQFDLAQQAAIDLSARMGTDLQSAALMVGKALNDPTKGITALTRAGIQFTAQQREQIIAMSAAGDAAGAQNIILGELARQFGGAAAAARAADPTAESRQAWAEFQETVGALVIKVLPPLTALLTSVLQGFNSLSPAMQETVVTGVAVAAALGPILSIFGSLVTVGAPLLSFLQMMGPVLSVVGKALLLIAMNPYVLGLAAVLGGIYLAWKNWDKIVAVVQRLYNGVKTWLQDKLGAVVNWLAGKLKWVGDLFFQLYDRVVGNSYVPDMVDGIAAEMARLDAVMVDPAEKAAKRTGESFRQMAGQVQGILDRLFPKIAEARKYAEEMLALEKGIADPVARENALRALRRENAGLPTEGREDVPLSFDTGASSPAEIADLDEKLRAFADSLPPINATVSAFAAEFRESMGEAFDEVGHQIKGFLLGAQSAGDALLNLIANLASKSFDKLWAGLGAVIGIPGFADGTHSAPRGMAWVGERGPELVRFRGGEEVIPNHQLGGVMGRGGNTFNIFQQSTGNERMDRANSSMTARAIKLRLNA